MQVPNERRRTRPLGWLVLLACLIGLAWWFSPSVIPKVQLPSVAVWLLATSLAACLLRWLFESRETIADLQKLEPSEFEEWVAGRFRQRGYKVARIGGANDGGVDLMMSRHGKTEIVQCKRYRADDAIGPATVRELAGALHHLQAQRAYLVTTCRFTPAARTFAHGKPIELWDGRRLESL